MDILNYIKSGRYCESLTEYIRRNSRVVNIGDVPLGGDHPIRVQSMTTTDTMDTGATIAQSIRMIEAGCEYVRITAPSLKEAENLRNIKKGLRERGYNTPLVADIHFTPNAAELAARIVEKVRVNPGNYVDKKKFEIKEYTDSAYEEELERIRKRFEPLVKICKEYGTAMRIGTNHGSLSDRIMNRYGDTPLGMVESAMEFLRICEDLDYHDIVLSMKASNPIVMVQAYRLLVARMDEEGMDYPLHLGVTEAGDGEDGRIKSAIGIGSLLEDGIGDTIRVSLTEEPEEEIPVCRDIVKRYTGRKEPSSVPAIDNLPYDPYIYKRRESFVLENIGGAHVPVVISDLSKITDIQAAHLHSAGYYYNASSDKWNIADVAADYIFTGTQELGFELPGTLKVILYGDTWPQTTDKDKYFPIFSASEFRDAEEISRRMNFVMIDCFDDTSAPFSDLEIFLDSRNEIDRSTAILCLSSMNKNAMQSVRRMYMELMIREIKNPVVNIVDSSWHTTDEHLIHYAAEAGALFLEGMGDGICLGMTTEAYRNMSRVNASGRNYTSNRSAEEFSNNTAFSILQATRTRVSKTEYISCPSCGRTLFDLQETTAMIRRQTDHLKGVKIAIMGCIVNGPGEMADADYGYVGTGPGKITLYRGKEVVKRNLPTASALDELIKLIKDDGYWIDRQQVISDY